MTGPIVIDDVRPRTPTGRYPAKAVVGEEVTISADVFRDGHDLVAARVRWHPAPAPEWHEQAMDATGNDRWHAVVVPATLGLHEFVIEAWTDRYATWRHRASARLRARPPAGSPDEAGWLADVNVDFEIGAGLLDAWMAGAAPHDRPHFAAAVEALRGADGDPRDRLDAALTPALAAATRGPLHHGEVTASATHMLWVDRERALVGAWYELFPRSYGGLRGTIDRLPAIAAMGFDVVYLPPVHPIGRSFRKGRDNALVAGPDDPGSPWAIGAMEGGHTAIDPGLGTADDFRALMAAAHDLGLEVALDYALQCSPDHPWARDHPEWFHHRPDGSIAHAENPPKKYEDIYPLNFCPELDRDRMALWAACKAIVDHWLGEGVRIFRVDNP
ncbi:MAG: maltotransferase domain-containing protein, partial [Acidimicrobiales bacterium]